MKIEKYRRNNYRSFRKLNLKLNALQKKRMARYRGRKTTICVLWFVIGICLLAIYQMVVLPRIDLKGDLVVYVEYKDKFEDPGFLSSYLGKDITSQVLVTGKVNSNRLGEYPITYQVTYGGFQQMKSRIVRVVDSKKPQITFTTGEKKLYICPNSKYQFDDYKAVDNYDGDITDKVKVKKIGNIMRYTVTDSYGNVTMVDRKIYFKDVTSPTIQLDSQEYVSLSLGDTFIDSTYHVNDNCCEKIDVDISGSVDTSKIGSYERIYTATDCFGNSTRKVQHVDVFEPVKKGVIYLTFDDGPRSGTTDIILNVLKEKGVKATFFVTSSGPDDLIKRAYLEGHSIGLHTSSHDYSIVYASGESYFNDLKIVSDRVERITGEKSRLIRFPGGSSNTISKKYSPGIMSYLTKEVVNRGYRYYDWNIDSRDAEGGRFDANQVAQFVTSNLSHDKVNMVLMHDIKVTTTDAIGKIIDYGKANGYTFDVITPFTDMVTQRVNN